MKLAIEILKFFKVVFAFLLLLLSAGIICLIAAFLYFAALMGAAWLTPLVLGAAWAFFAYRDRARNVHSKCCSGKVGQFHGHGQIQTATKAHDTHWRTAVGCIGILIGLKGSGLLYIAYEVTRGVPCNVEPWLLFVVGVFELIIAAVCILRSRFWLTL